MNREARLSAEQAVIGCILIDANYAMPLLSDLAPEDFSAAYYRNIFTLCQSFYLENKAIDTVTLMNELKDDGYKVILVRAVEAVPILKRVAEYAKIIKECSKREKALLGTNALSELIRGGAALDECQSAALKMCEGILSTQTDRIWNAREGFVQFLATKQKPKTYITTGLQKLDQFTYIDRGDYVVIGGRPSTGKTALTLQLMLHMAKYHRIVYFSLETSGEKLFDRMIASYTMTPLSQIKSQAVQDWGKIARAADIFSKLQLSVVDAAGWTVAQIRAKAAQLKAEIIIIDYLSLIKSQGKSLYERVTNISVDLHTMAQQSKLTVIALSQLNREGKGQPDMTHLRESGQIEQDADVILLLHNPSEGKEDDSNNQRLLIIAKNKEGRTGAIKLDFRGDVQRFYVQEMRY